MWRNRRPIWLGKKTNSNTLVDSKDVLVAATPNINIWILKANKISIFLQRCGTRITYVQQTVVWIRVFGCHYQLTRIWNRHGKPQILFGFIELNLDFSLHRQKIRLNLWQNHGFLLIQKRKKNEEKIFSATLVKHPTFCNND